MCRPKPPANPPPSPQYTAPVPPPSIPPPNYFLTPWSETVAYKQIWFARGDYLPVSTTTGIIRGISFVSPTRIVGNRIKELSCVAIIFWQKKNIYYSYHLAATGLATPLLNWRKMGTWCRKIPIFFFWPKTEAKFLDSYHDHGWYCIFYCSFFGGIFGWSNMEERIVAHRNCGKAKQWSCIVKQERWK